MSEKHMPIPCEGTLKGWNCYIHPIEKRMVFCRVHKAAPDLLETVRAIKARIDGEWDNPALVKMGPLSTNPTNDILAWAEAALEKVEGRS